MSDIPAYKMNPQLDDLIYGSRLKNGMVVRIEDTLFTSRSKPEAKDWVVVTELTFKHMGENGTLVQFIAVAHDNTKSSVTYNASYCWFVRKSSMR